MTDLEVKDFLTETKAIFRDFKLSEMIGDCNNKITLKTPRKGFFSFLYSGWDLIDDLNEMGGVLTGSTALSFYRFNGESLLGRSPQDWDYLLDRETFLKFCGKNNISNFKYSTSRIMVDIKTGVNMGSDGYGGPDRFMFKHEIDIVAQDGDKTPYIEVGKYKVATLESIIQGKLDLIELSPETKHIKDCNYIISKLHSHKR